MKSMKKVQSVFLPFALLFVFALISACAGKSNTLKDGYYTAEAADFDSHGWKEYLSVFISEGRIILVEYNAYNGSGFIKSWDMDYMRVMNASDGTYPNAYARYYASRFLEEQGTEGIDALSGATTSYRTFIKLADAVLKNAREGNSGTALVYFEGGGTP